MTDGRRSVQASFERRGVHWKPHEVDRAREASPQQPSHDQRFHLHGTLRTRRASMVVSGREGWSC